jgi:MFS family permease
LLGDIFRSLSLHNYRLWAAGALVSNIGTWVQRTAQDWLVFTELTNHDASTVGVAMALQFGPQLLFLPWTGSAAERFEQRRLLMATQTVLGALALALGLLTVTGAVQLWHVYVFAFLSGTAAAFDAPVRQTFAWELVGERDLHNAVALNSTSFNAARMIGPAVGGLIIAAVGTGWAFLINGMSYLAPIIALVLVRTSELHPIARTKGRTGGFVEGLRYVRGRPDLIAVLVILFLFGSFGMNSSIYISTMAVRAFGAEAAGYGILMSIMAVGAVGGSLLNASRAAPTLKTIIIGATLFALSCALCAMAPTYWLFAVALVPMGASAMTVLNASNTFTQTSTDAAVRGRVTALRIAAFLGGAPFGSPMVGHIADVFGPRWALTIGATAGLAAALVGVWSLTRTGVRKGKSNA